MPTLEVDKTAHFVSKCEPKTAVELRPAQELAPAGLPNDPEALIRFALEHKSGVEIIERLTALHDKRRAEMARQAFDDALAAFQAECPIIIKRKDGAKNMYKYAPLDHIVTQTKQLIQRHGFSFSITSEIEQGWVKAVCKIRHTAGHTEPTEFKCPIDGNEKNAMSTPQRYGAAMTFAKRYAFCNGFGILTADEDLDARPDKPKPQGPSTTAPDKASLKELARELWDVTKSVGGTERNWEARNRWMWDESVISDTESAPELTTDRFQAAIKAARAKLSKDA